MSGTQWRTYVGRIARRSVKAGPLRFNLSKTGIGVSAGVPGLRVGTGPRGNYVRVGSGGSVYLSSSRDRRTTQNMSATLPDETLEPAKVPLDDASGLSALELRPTGGDDVVRQLNEAARRLSWGWISALSAFVIGGALMPWGFLIWLVAIPGCWWLFLRDGLRRKVVVLYDVGDAPAVWFDRFVEAWDGPTRSQKLWRTVQSGRVQTTYQHKANAGAGALVQRIAANARMRPPKHLVTNVEVPSLQAGKEALYFLPDRVLICLGKTYTDVAYRHLVIRRSATQFVERPGQVPKDSQLIGETWQYVNVKGGPDRRFKDNPVLPVVQYGQLDVTSAQGLSWSVQSSRVHALEGVGLLLTQRPV